MKETANQTWLGRKGERERVVKYSTTVCNLLHSLQGLSLTGLTAGMRTGAFSVPEEKMKGKG